MSMQNFAKIITWSATGAFIGGPTVFLCFLGYDRFFENSGDASVRGFQTGQEIMMGIGGTVVGFVLGALFAIIRCCHRSKEF